MTVAVLTKILCRFDQLLSPFWPMLVAVLTNGCRRFDSSCRRFDHCCRRFGVSPFWHVAVFVVAVPTCRRYDRYPKKRPFFHVLEGHISETAWPTSRKICTDLFLGIICTCAKFHRNRRGDSQTIGWSDMEWPLCDQLRNPNKTAAAGFLPSPTTSENQRQHYNLIAHL